MLWEWAEISFPVSAQVHAKGFFAHLGLKVVLRVVCKKSV